ELEDLFQLETTERKVILPIWKDVSESEVRSFSPILASRLGADAAAGLPKIVEDIRRAVGLVDRYKQISSSHWKERMKQLDADVAHAKRVEQLSSTGEAVELVSKVAFELIDEAWATAERLVKDLSALKLHLPPRKNERHYFVIHGPRRLTLHLPFSNTFVNSIEYARLKVIIFRAKDDWDEQSETKILENYELRPAFDKQMKVLWTDSTLTF